jgi:hypothetical protein
MPQRDLTGISDEEIEPYGGNGRYPDMIDDIEDIRLTDQRNDDKEEEKSDPQPQPSKICSKDG